ncbi:MAG: 4-alpha-glucanotransferase [Clostridiales bacterium]|nr:4-alpha-glucanotransferase [Clostridiales bacterium]
MRFERSSGLLLHPTSLPSKYGVGDLGEEAYKFIDFLKNTKQKIWQILPLNPPGYGESPYQCFSAFAGNVLLISIDRLMQSGLLTEEEILVVPDFSEIEVEFSKVKRFKDELFIKAFSRFDSSRESERYSKFKEENKYWLDDFCFYMAIKEYFDYRAWNYWDKDIAFRNEDAIKKYRSKLTNEIKYQEFLQYIFYLQWNELKEYANKNDVKILGDLPIFVAYDSSDAWVYPELFQLKSDGNPNKVAGVPPDYFSETGQLWGNPHFNWERMQEDNFLWWRKRFENLLSQVDIIRIDHFRGFEAYWEIDASEKTAINGKWVKAPGYELFATIKESLGELPIIVENLGFITPEVENLKNEFEFPGMKIMQFSFDKKTPKRERPDGYEKHCIAYTGTHDNDTLLGWYKKIIESNNKNVLKILKKYHKIEEKMLESEVCWRLFETLYKTNASIVVLPMQDILCLDNEGRMNYPSTIGGNWLWRYRESDLTNEIERKLINLNNRYNR